MSGQDEGLIRKHGGYRNLKSFQVAQLAYDVTVRFCDRYINIRSRTHDQMVQAARSGVQNIAEGSQASGTSKKFELKLTNVARASLEELKLDYEDFLRQRDYTLWDRDDPRRMDLVARRCKTADDVAVWVGETHARERREGQKRQDGLGGLDGQSGHGREAEGQCGLDGEGAADDQDDSSTQSIQSTSSTSSTSFTPSTHQEIAANGALLLIDVACSLLDRQITAQATSFENEGGFTERLYHRRQQARKKR
jgi:four helix bundle suffix protein